MSELITGFVGLDVHAESTSIAVAEVGREAARFVGTVGARLAELTKALGKLGRPQSLQVVYEAGPCGYALARERRVLTSVQPRPDKTSHPWWRLNIAAVPRGVYFRVTIEQQARPRPRKNRGSDHAAEPP